MTNLGVGSQGVVDVEIQRINLMPVLGGLELTFGVIGTTSATPVPCWVSPYAAEVQVSGQKQGFTRIGVAPHGIAWRDRTDRAGLAVQWEFRLPLIAHQLETIEEVRDGGDLLFKLAVSGSGGPLADMSHFERMHGELLKQVGQSDWIRELNNAKALDVQLLEIVMPFVDPPKASRELFNAMREAQRLYTQGDWRQAVESCRAAMDALKKRLGRDENWKSAAYNARNIAGGPREMSMDQRELVLEAAIHEFVHGGAHPEGETFTRRDARLAIAVTASVLAFRLR